MKLLVLPLVAAICTSCATTYDSASSYPTSNYRHVDSDPFGFTTVDVDGRQCGRYTLANNAITVVYCDASAWGYNLPRRDGSTDWYMQAGGKYSAYKAHPDGSSTEIEWPQYLHEAFRNSSICHVDGYSVECGSYWRVSGWQEGVFYSNVSDSYYGKGIRFGKENDKLTPMGYGDQPAYGSYQTPADITIRVVD